MVLNRGITKMEKQIWLKSVTAEELSEIEVLDWLEGYGLVMSLAERNYIRRYFLFQCTGFYCPFHIFK